MKKVSVLLCSATVGLATMSMLTAQSAGSGSTARWNAIAGTTIYDSAIKFRGGTTPANLMNNSGILLNAAQTQTDQYGSWTSDSYGEVTSSRDLRVYSRSSITDFGRAHELPSRINSGASAYIGEFWRADSPTLSVGTSFPALASMKWDGEMIMRVPSPLTTPSLGTSPNFSEVGVIFNYRVYVLDDNYPNSEPTPILGYATDYLILRADGTNQNDADFLPSLEYFDDTVYIYDPAQPGFSTGTVDLSISGTAMSGLNPGEYGYEVVIGGNLIPFTATVGERYLVDFGLEVYTNVTGASGSAEANFLNTGSVNFSALDPSEASFTPIVIPEPSSSPMILAIIACTLAAGLRRRRATAI